MNQDLAQYAPPLLLVAGGLFQWVRQYGNVPDRWTYVYAIALALGVYVLTYDFTAKIGLQLAVIHGLLWLSGNTGTVLGGTFIASGMAKAGLSVVPVTNSK